MGQFQICCDNWGPSIAAEFILYSVSCYLVFIFDDYDKVRNCESSLIVEYLFASLLNYSFMHLLLTQREIDAEENRIVDRARKVTLIMQTVETGRIPFSISPPNSIPEEDPPPFIVFYKRNMRRMFVINTGLIMWGYIELFDALCTYSITALMATIMYILQLVLFFIMFAATCACGKSIFSLCDVY